MNCMDSALEVHRSILFIMLVSWYLVYKKHVILWTLSLYSLQNKALQECFTQKFKAMFLGFERIILALSFLSTFKIKNLNLIYPFYHLDTYCPKS